MLYNFFQIVQTSTHNKKRKSKILINKIQKSKKTNNDCPSRSRPFFFVPPGGAKLWPPSILFFAKKRGLKTMRFNE
jgi:hypothetical protein